MPQVGTVAVGSGLDVNRRSYSDIQLVYNTSITTTNSYATVLTIDTRAAKDGVITIHNTGGTNDLYYRARGSVKDSATIPDSSDNSWAVIKTDIRVYNTASSNGPATRIEFFDNTYNFIDIQVKSVTSGQSTTAEIYSKAEM